MHRGKIEELTYAINDMLTRYLEVHNGMFAQPWWRSIPVPGLFKSIPFDRYEIQISEVERVLRQIEGHVRELYPQAAASEKTFLSTLHQYTVALLKTVLALAPVVAGLKRKTDGKPFGMSAYGTALATYKEAEKGYHALGAQMNREWRKYQAASNAVPAGRNTAQTCEVRILSWIACRKLDNW